LSGKEAPTTKADKKSSLKRFVSEGIPIGVIAYNGAKPIGWCSVAPRETYQKLENSRTMPRVTNSETVTWSILCFFVHREYRGHHVASTLLEGAVSYARMAGAQVVEGYPFDSAGITATHRW
jgi:GNAT superfamily N-acetyltransferase